MDESNAVFVFAALAQPTRLEVFRRLVGAYPETVQAGELARRCGVPHNTMSSHLAVLTRAGLVTVERNGRAMNYRADLDRFSELITFLTRDCCSGRPDICTPLIAGLADDIAVARSAPKPKETVRG